MDTQNIQIAQTILSRWTNSGRITTPDIKMNYRSVVGRTKWYLHKKAIHKAMEQHQAPKYEHRNSSHLIFDKYYKNIS